ncbi:hypothetical protein TL16_g02871 [Triparma laevis f. inornata]|uniref:CRAL-TRIO domain-containing protein n=1 Tax=Triparma laevis f. inornata TaxID=1714386 RepID=A0A9W6ZYW9_9STRA|nr:hypothetical protein TL16_g02871 [Triparma laevis f. inornata]
MSKTIQAFKAGITLIGLPLVADSVYQRRIEKKGGWELRIPVLHAYLPQASSSNIPATVDLPVVKSKLLKKQNLHFNVMKEYYPMYIAGRTKKGNLVYYEEMGNINMPKLHSRGVTVPTLLDHYECSTLFAFEVLHPSDAAQMLSIFDAEGCSFKELKGDAMKFMKTASNKMQMDYAHRNCGVMVVNCPSWIATGWRALVKMRLFSAETISKTKILSKEDTFEGLLEKIDEDQIPKKYGGKLSFNGGISGDDNCRRWSTDEVRLRDWVMSQPHNKDQVNV